MVSQDIALIRKSTKSDRLIYKEKKGGDWNEIFICEGGSVNNNKCEKKTSLVSCVKCEAVYKGEGGHLSRHIEHINLARRENLMI